MKYCHFDCALLIHIDSIAFKTKMQFRKVNKLLRTYSQRHRCYTPGEYKVKNMEHKSGHAQVLPPFSKVPLSVEGFEPHLFPGPYESTPQSTSIGSAVLQG